MHLQDVLACNTGTDFVPVQFQAKDDDSCMFTSAEGIIRGEKFGDNVDTSNINEKRCNDSTFQLIKDLLSDNGSEDDNVLLNCSDDENCPASP